MKKSISSKINRLRWSTLAAAVIILFAAWDIVQIKARDEIQELSTNIVSNEYAVIIVNGHSTQKAILDIINSADIEDIIIYKDDIAIAQYEPLFGSLVENGVVVLTLKDGKNSNMLTS